MSPSKRLRALLDGRIASRTGDVHRGRGLPIMKEACNEHRISNLVVISNRAAGFLESEGYQDLNQGFEGTIIYWEVSEPPEEGNQ